jgi:hypothetical protein
MSTQSVDRAAEGTEVCRPVVSVICEGIDWFDQRNIEELENNNQIRKILGT